MIRMIENPAELAGEDITGKYILRKLNYHWFAYGKAAIVIACKGTILHLEREETVYSERWSRRAYTGTGKRYLAASVPFRRSPAFAIRRMTSMPSFSWMSKHRTNSIS